MHPHSYLCLMITDRCHWQHARFEQARPWRKATIELNILGKLSWLGQRQRLTMCRGGLSAPLYNKLPAPFGQAVETASIYIQSARSGNSWNYDWTTGLRPKVAHGPIPLLLLRRDPRFSSMCTALRPCCWLRHNALGADASPHTRSTMPADSIRKAGLILRILGLVTAVAPGYGRETSRIEITRIGVSATETERGERFRSSLGQKNAEKPSRAENQTKGSPVEEFRKAWREASRRRAEQELRRLGLYTRVETVTEVIGVDKSREHFCRTPSPCFAVL